MSTRRLDVRIDSIAAGGDGVARAEGLVVFVPRSAPGDEATVRVTPKGRFGRGELETLRHPSAERVEPPCPHYTRDRCGGCQLQHLAYNAQLAAKRGIVRDAIERIGKRQTPPPEVRASERAWRYRRKLTLGLRWRDGRWIAGLHPYDDPVGVFDLADCPITDERVMGVWREVMRSAQALPRVPALRGSVRLLEQGAAFVLEGGARWPGQHAFFEAVPSLSALWWRPENGHRRLVARRGEEVEPGASFAQVNVAVGAALHGYVVERAAAHAPATVVDAYAGAGETAVRLAALGARVTAIELDREAAAYCASRMPAGSRALSGRVEELLPQALPSDVVIVNPPRTGVDERVTAALEAQATPPRAIVYVSCNPATLARDLARLPRYRIATLVAFDMFPQTAHVETVCELIPEAA